MSGELFSIGQVANVAGTSVKTIRYYHDIGLLPATEISSSGRRYYSIHDIWQLQLILTLRHMGFGLEDIRKIISEGDILTSIGLQIRLIESQIEHQTNILAILREALESGSDEHALRFIQDIGNEVGMELDNRKNLLNRIESVLVETDAPVDWKKQMLQPFLSFVGTNPTEAQLAAQSELLELLGNEDIAQEIQQKIAPFWSMVREQQPDAEAWNQTVQSIMVTASQLLAEGHASGSREVQELALRLRNEVAGAVKVDVTPLFTELFAKQLRNMTQGAFKKFWELVSVGATVQPHVVLEAMAQALLLASARDKEGRTHD